LSERFALTPYFMLRVFAATGYGREVAAMFSDGIFIKA